MRGFKIQIVLSFILCFGIQSFGQESIAFRYTSKEVSKDGDITSEHYSMLERKIKNSYNSSVVFTTQTPFSIIPNIQVLEVKNAGEMDMVKVVKVGVTLAVKDIDNNIHFNQYRTEVIATEKDMSRTITKAINQIKTPDPKLKEFFNKAEESILSFYTKNCDRLLKSATTHIERKQYNKAYALLKYVPESVNCYNDASRLITSIYNRSINENCKEMLHKATIQKASKNYERALKFLHHVDPQAECYPEVENLMNDIGSLIEKNISAKLDREKKEYENKPVNDKLETLLLLADFLQLYNDDKIDNF